tara:strand:- start:374 stop:1075 length:702 start_codon:yes stop_codon:yes gene_type:complete
MNDFTKYNALLLKAYQKYANTRDLVSKKQDIIRSLVTAPKPTILFAGFNPLCLLVDNFGIMEADESVLKFLTEQDKTYIEVDPTNTTLWDYVIATDEYYTFAKDEQDQEQKINILSAITKRSLITTLRDYKNMNHRDKEFSMPISVVNDTDRTIYLEYHIHCGTKHWDSLVYELDGEDNQTHGPYKRMPMYFKQLAKFSIDGGATTFQVQKNMMWKGLIRRNFEHVISINYDK